MSVRATNQNYASTPAPPATKVKRVAPLSALTLAAAAELSIIIPTFNERDNVRNLIAAVSEALPGISWELIFVDDNSPDGTASLVREIARSDPRIRCLHRFGRRGLSSACVEGIMSTSSDIVAVMDGDSQHDERALYGMFKLMAGSDADIIVGSRYIDGGSVGDWDRGRAAMSRFATRVANKMTGTSLTDPMSGFFMMRRDVFLDSLPKLSSIGFKILMDISASCDRTLKIVEIPYEFRLRQVGESKLDALALWEFLLLVLDKSIGRYLPARFIGFALIGGSGVLLHLCALAILFKFFGIGFTVAQSVAALAATTANFLLNNALTYRDRRPSGARLFLGWMSFNLVCMIGAVANIGIASWMFANNSWWFIDGFTGAAIGAVWNYAMSSIFTWVSDNIRAQQRVQKVM
jgi:dolichol-phosphate mannosyltransferase